MLFPLSIILDQKDWIYLARGYNGADPNLETVAKYLIRSSTDGKVMVPLSITHFMETVKRLNNPSRHRLAEFMYELSKGNVIVPATTSIKFELDNACRRLCGNNQVDLRSVIFGKGISHMLGKKPDITTQSGGQIDPKLRSYLLNEVLSAETILKLLKWGVSRDTIVEQNKRARSLAETIEKIREETKSIKDADLRHSVELVKYFHSSIDPPLIKCLLKHGVSPDVIGTTFSSKAKIMNFFRTIPSAYCNFELDFYRNSQKQRKIQPNDMHDIMGLAVAVPYANVVITEPIWQNGIKSRKLDLINPLVVLTSRDLPKLPNLIERIITG